MVLIHLIDFSERMSPLGNATAEECADYCVALFSDLTRKVTMQNLFHDGGFSSMGMSLKAIEQYQKSFEECDCDDKVNKYKNLFFKRLTIQVSRFFYI